MKKILAILLLTAGGLYVPAAAVAQPAGASMLAPGIYTTPEISRRCQNYARSRVASTSAGDTERQSVFLACMQRLSRDGNGDPGHRGAAAGPGRRSSSRRSACAAPDTTATRVAARPTKATAGTARVTRI